MKSKKLYRVILRGMKFNATSGVIHGVSYVVAYSTDEAYKIVRSNLDKKGLGFDHERELDKIELIADCYEYNNVGYQLFLTEEKEGEG